VRACTYAGEWLDDRARELAFGVEEVVRDAEAARDRACVGDRLGRAAAAELARGLFRFVPRPDPERDPDDIVALLDQQRGCDRRVDPAAHSHDDAHGHGDDESLSTTGASAKSRSAR